ncbi:MAG: TRAP transporter substrate-binding protein [Pararhodobacter sp.]|nr:TRAP transporter substrate-binding protein [Pararhodobacter sp.]
MYSLRSLTLIVPAVLSFGLGVSAAPAAAQEFRLGLITPPPHVWTRAANRFSERIAEETAGEVTVSVFPGGQLGSEGDMMQQMQTGLVDMAWLTGAIVSVRLPEFSAWFTPFLFDNVEEAIAATQNEPAQEMLANLSQLGIRGQGYSFAGMRHILMAGDPVESPSDLANQRVRIYPFAPMQVWYETMGAVPTPMGLTEVYPSLQSGLLNGIDIDFDAMVGLDMQEVAQGLTLTTHMAWPMIAMMTDEAFARLSEEHQETFLSVMQETLAWADQEQIAADARHLENLRSAITVVELDDAESLFSEANDAFQAAFGEIDLVARFQQAVRDE